MRLQCPASR